MRLGVSTSLLLATTLAWSAQAQEVKNQLPITPATLCQGLKGTMLKVKQGLREEVASLCNDVIPTPLLLTLIAKPFEGTALELQRIRVGNASAAQDVEVLVAYAMRFQNKTPAAVLLNDDPYIRSFPRYQESSGNSGLKIDLKFLDAPRNLGDSEVAFQIQQITSHSGNGVNFKDVSVHDLKLYYLYQQNFDFLLAIRTLNAPTNLLRKVNAIKIAMVDPTNANNSYAIVVLHVVMSGNGHNDRSINKLLHYFEADAQANYKFGQVKL